LCKAPGRTDAARSLEKEEPCAIQQHTARRTGSRSARTSWWPEPSGSETAMFDNKITGMLIGKVVANAGTIVAVAAVVGAGKKWG